ncbi:hypothetical protein PISMIDRAFT_120613 [Pisolithus microcarpus 441]|uniref:Unplaced genomic scaffold scaffold_383, whole genome shotgun sequence n=1 Tax=Pisolithus microcarpus 441 TaxID=765257 RepID=A0A0C9YQG7_9AGAM|nr:hypothetical protein PISMIDRAFT_120613 [Pisolithus microcarpus 441]
MENNPDEPIQMPRKKTQNDYIREWVPRQEEFLRIILEMEAPPEPRTCSRCEKDGVYRCVDCMHQPLCCTDCCCAMHRSNPFHRIEQWTGEFFEQSALHLLGLAIHLGHGGAPCPYTDLQKLSEQGYRSMVDLLGMLPFDSEEWEDVDDIPLNLQPPSGSKYLTIVDITGIHYMVIESCQCPNAEEYHLQLLRAKLWPSTFLKPSTAFTFAVLDDFLRDNLECGTSGMNYFSKLRRITSGLFPHLVPVSGYWELLRVAQQWRLIKLRKWNGFQQMKGSPLKGGLALFCAACPQPGINVDTTEALHKFVAKVTAYIRMLTLQSWKYTHTMVMDGNFKAEHIKERCPEDQVQLMDGHGYMVSHPEYQEYLQATPHITEKSSCNNHKALSVPNANRGKFDCTGIGATACVQHGCFYPHSVVDFQKGERQLNMDYSLANALAYNMAGIQNVVCFYDINCSYMKNLRRWVGGSNFIHIPSSIRIVPGIGIWHVHGHKKECYARYSPLFIKGARWVDGEIIETLWSMLNVVSASARGMSSPHRQELLDFQMNDSNFMKMIRLDAAVSSRNRHLWRKQEESALRERVDDCTVMDMFEIKLSKAPTVHGVELRLLQLPNSSGSPHGAASWLARGIKIEEAEIIFASDESVIAQHQSEVNRLAAARRLDRLAADQSAFMADVALYLGEVWQGNQEDMATDVANSRGSDTPVFDGDDASEDDGTDRSAGGLPPIRQPPDDPLPLPSTLSIRGELPSALQSLADMELELQIGQANDALHGLQLALVDKAVIFRNAVRPAKSYSMRTRAWGMIHMVDNSVKKQAKIYKRCRDAMIALHADAKILSRYQELTRSHLTINTAIFQQNAHSHRGDHLPWFWSIDIPKDTESKSWMSEFYRIHWSRAKAVQDRWQEEEELLICEFQWTANFFKYRADEWGKQKLSRDMPQSRGICCYAARQQKVYDRLAEHCSLKWQGIRLPSV